MAASNGKGKRPTKRTAKKSAYSAGRRNLVPGTGLQQNQIEFLEAFVSSGGKVREAAELTGIFRERHYEWLRTNETYVAAYQQALAEARKIREDTVRAALREAWETGWQEQILEETLEARPNPENTSGPPIMVVVEQKRKATKKRFLNALFYEANTLWGNPATLQVNTQGPTQINIGNLRELIDRADAVLLSENGDAPIDMIESGEDE